MGYWRLTVIALACIGHAVAQAPPRGQIGAWLAGEWTGIGDAGTHCYLKLEPDGWGWVLIDGGAGDLLGARLRWRSQQQTLLIDEVTPLAASPRLRTMPLVTLKITSGFNNSLRLDWQTAPGTCQLQRTDITAHQLSQARNLVETLQSKHVKP